MMLRLGRALQFGGAFLVATWLTAAQAQLPPVAADNSADNGEDHVAPLRSSDGEHVASRSSTNNGANSGGYGFGGYEPTCGCMAHQEPSCGCCQGGCGCGGSCASACCCEDDCCGCCCTPGCSCGWYGGGEVIWVKPHWNSFTSLFVNGNWSHDVRAYDYSFDPTARFFVGYTGCNGVGVRASWWEYDHDSAVDAAAHTTGVTNVDSLGFSAGWGEAITTQQSLKLQTIDLEFTECFEACGGNIIASFGGRYAKFDLRTHERLIAAWGTLIDSFEHQDRFEGFGPTVGIEFIRPLCCSGLSFYSSLRGSVIFDQSHLTDRYIAPNGSQDSLFTREENTVRAIADLQIALQYCHGRWFARGGWQAQYWDAAAQTDFSDRDSDKASLGLEGFFLTLGAGY